MSDHDEKRRRWGTLKQKILASRSGKLSNNDGTKASKTVKNTLARFSRMKHEKSPKSGTCNCLPQPTKSASTSTGIPLLLCSATHQKFKRLGDDDTFSTRPLIGFASRYTHNHYSDVWLADYINTTRKKAQIGSAQIGPQRKGANHKVDGGPEKTKSTGSQNPRNSALKDTNIPESLGQEIDRLSRTLNKASFVRDANGTQGVRRSHHVSGFDVQSTTSHTSSLDTFCSEFSFEADFTQLAQQQPNVPVVDSTPRDAILQEQQQQQQQQHPESTLSTVRIIPSSSWDHSHTHAHTGAPNRQSQRHQKPHSPDRLFQPVLQLSELDEQGDLMLYEQSVRANKSPSLSSKDCHQWHNDSNHSTVGCQEEAQDPPGQVAVGIQQDLMVFPEPNIVNVNLVDEYKRHPDEDILDPISSDEDRLVKPVDEVCFSSEESNVASEITTEAGSSLTGGHVEAVPRQYLNDSLIKQGATARDGDAVKKAKCVVVYDKYFSETDNRFYDDVPANVKEIVDRLEVLRRMQEDHAEKFGYKHFLPIPLEDELEPRGYCEYQKASNNQFLHMLSFSFESESLLSVSPVEFSDQVQQASV